MATKHKTALSVLVAARKLITPRKKWTQRAFALDKDGEWVGSTSPRAVCWCSEGAIKRAAGLADHARREAVFELSQTVHQSVIGFNDALMRTHAQILAAFDRTIKKLRADSQTRPGGHSR